MNSLPPTSPAKSTALFLRLEGPFQSWGGRTIGRFRRTETVPTKSGVIGLLGAALGLSRQQLSLRLPELNQLHMSVRVDRAGLVLEDYQTVGARVGILAADGKIKKTAGTGEPEPIISPREYLVDASFLVILQGEEPLITELAAALQTPHWPLFLGRKRCVPGTNVFAGIVEDFQLVEALNNDGNQDHSLLPADMSPAVRVVTDLIEPHVFGQLTGTGAEELLVLYDQAKSYVTDRLTHLDPPLHAGRVVLDFEMLRPQSSLPRPQLSNSLFGLAEPEYTRRSQDRKKEARDKAGKRCIFCRFEPNDPQQLHAHHLTYQRQGRERVNVESTKIGDDDLLMLCEECHAAVTMLEYDNGFGLQRIDPRNPLWKSRILAARDSQRRDNNLAHSALPATRTPRLDSEGKPLDLIESVIPLQAGSSFPPDAPGNRWLANRHHIHQRLSMAFPQAGAPFAAPGYGVSRDEGGFLFRIEDGPVAQVIVRSRILPDWGRAFANADWLIQQPLPAQHVFAPQAFEEGAELSFDLEANPTKRLAADGPEGRKGARVPRRDQAGLIQWIQRRAEDGGFEILDDPLNITPVGLQTANMRHTANRSWFAVRFQGVLRVTNPVAFGAALTNGIGPAKGFGFGLMRVAKR